MNVPQKAHQMTGYINKKWKSYWHESPGNENRRDHYTPQKPS